MNADPVILLVAAMMVAVFLVFVVLFFLFFRLWLQARLTNTPVSLADIIGMKLRNCPPTLIVHALIALHQRGVKVSASEAEGYYLAAVSRGERITSAAELADLIEDVKGTNPQTPA
jgi:uncharacterized protein YqfA (UPF0365 family)